MKIQYLAWLSSEGERRERAKKEVLWAGMVRSIPEEYKHLLEPQENRQYAIIWNLEEEKNV